MATFTFSTLSLSLSSSSTSRVFVPAFPIRYHHRFPNKLRLQPLKCSSSEPQETAVPKFTHKLIAGVAGIGFLETSYLAYLKLTGSDVFCPVGGGTCSDILDSDYAFVFGVPLPLIGMVAYGFVAALGFQLASNKLRFGLDKSNAQLVLVGATTSMAAASAYFLYILTTKFDGSSCSYCLLSAFLSFTLFFVTLKDIGLQEVNKQVGLQLLVASLVILTLNASYGNSKSASSSLAEIDLPYTETEITSPSSPFAISLARHLHSIGAKMYGAFWCSHCLEQKQMFGREAVKELDYVECFPQGYHTGTKMNRACLGVKLEGFPTWIINGQVLSGEQELSELAQVSGYNESVKPS